MKNLRSPMLWVLASGLGCGNPSPPAQEESATVAPEPSPARVGLDRATELVRTHVFTVQKPEMNPEAQFPLEEITPPEVWEGTGWQLFKVTAGVLQCHSYAIRGDRVESFAGGFGGSGLMSVCLADFDDDVDGGPGRDSGERTLEMAYTWSWGSGIHRTELGVCRVRPKGLSHEKVPLAFRGDLFVRADEGEVLVEVGRYEWKFGQWVRESDLGKLVVTPKDGRLNPSVQLQGNLREEDRSSIWLPDN